MLDLGEFRCAGRRADMDQTEDTLVLYEDCDVALALADGLGGVKGDEGREMFDARLVVLVRGDGVRGMRPPAIRVEKMPRWLLIGVDTVAVAIVSNDQIYLKKLRKSKNEKIKKKSND